MEKREYDEPFIERIKTIKYHYEGKIPNGLYHYYHDVLNGINIEMYMQMFSLSKDDLIKYARVCKILDIYKEILALVEIIETEADILEKDELEEYQGAINELQGEGETYLNDINVPIQGDETIDFNDSNLIIYSNYIDESKQKIINSHSGKGEETQKSIANIIEQLKVADYFGLRKKGYIHQIVQVDANKPCYIEGNAFERIGRISTKVNYIRIPISDNNREVIKKLLNSDFSMLYLVVSYGDFSNEGLDERRYYSEIYADFKKHYQELVAIINLFKYDFTDETKLIAMDLINKGFEITEDLLSIAGSRNI
ncbi:MAG: hypothetical protein IKR74_04495 [Bacilli bacterium]|nr:hypothetical protein [Bacilli bacterium]